MTKVTNLKNKNSALVFSKFIWITFTRRGDLINIKREATRDELTSELLLKSALCTSKGNSAEIDAMRAVLFFLSVVVTPLVHSWPNYLSSIPVDYVPHVCKDETGQINYYNITSVGHEFCDQPYPERNNFGLVCNILFLYVKAVNFSQKEYKSTCLTEKTIALLVVSSWIFVNSNICRWLNSLDISIFKQKNEKDN